MQASLLLQLLILLVVANGAAVVAKKLLGDALGYPLDGGALFFDQQSIFGPAKIIRGVVASLLATSLCAALMGLGWGLGALVAAFTMAGAFVELHQAKVAPRVEQHGRRSRSHSGGPFSSRCQRARATPRLSRYRRRGGDLRGRRAAAVATSVQVEDP
jgi:hypothetical protein